MRFKIAFLFGQLGIQYILLHTLAQHSICQHRSSYTSSCTCCCSSQLLFISPKISPPFYIIFSQLHSIENSTLCTKKTNNAFFYRQIQKWLYWHLPSKTNQFFFFQTLNLLWHVSHPYCFGMCPIYSRLSSQFLRKTCLI